MQINARLILIMYSSHLIYRLTIIQQTVLKMQQ